MKKILSYVLTSIIIFTFFSFSFISAQTTPSITIENVTGYNGGTVDVKISITNNPGIIAMAFGITYNSTSLDYLGYEDGYLTNYNVKDHTDKGLLSFVNVEDSNVNTNGVMITLKFKIKDTALLGKYEINIVNSNPEKYGSSLHNSFANKSEEFIVPTVYNGSITVNEAPKYVLGDVSGDGVVNNKDIGFLMQYMNGWNVEIVVDAADVNCDGTVNNKDYGLLMQYTNGWDVQLGVSKPKDNNSYGNQGPLIFF